MKKSILLSFSLAICTFSTAQDAIGTTEGEFSVSAIGSAVYNIPIQARDGYSSFSPRLSLTYNSSGDNNIVGYGWGITGLSSISATPHTPYFDETNLKGISVSSTDAYSLDGIRLLRKSGTNGKKNSKYVTEEEQYCNISIDSAFSTTPKSFVLKKPDGTTMRYGSTSSGIYRYPNISSTKAYGWLLDYAEDKDGNFINYTYTYYNKVPYLTRIDYGGNKNTGRAPYCSITLSYESRPDTIETRVLTQKFYYTKRLASVTCKYNNFTYRRYVLQYNSASYYSRLNSVKEYGTGTQGFPSTTFSWNAVPSLQMTSTSTDVTGRDYGCRNHDVLYFSGDVDKDGVTELIGLCPHANNYSNTYVFKKNGNNFTRDKTIQTSSIFNWYDGWEMGQLFRGGFVARFKQKNSIVIAYHRTGDNPRVRFECYNYDDTADGQDFELQYTDEMPAYMSADYNKDDIDEITYIEKKELSDTTIRLVKINVDWDANSHFIQTDQLLSISGLSDTQKTKKIKGCLASDFDGDGLTDILVSCETFSIVLWNTNGSFSGANSTILTSIKHGNTLQSADFNGDGLADLIVNEPSSTVWKKAVSTGQRTTSLFTVSYIPLLLNHGFKMQNAQDSLYFCVVQDLDEDGLSDLIVSGKSSTSQKICWAKAERNGSFTQKGLKTTTLGGTGCIKSWDFASGDFNGDGYMECVGYGGDLTLSGNSSNYWRLYKGCNFSPGSNKINSITNGLGKTTTITYGSLLDGYSNTASAGYPLSRFNYPLPVVKGISDSWQNTVHQRTYSYSDGISHLTGKGFLGFGSMRETADFITKEVSLETGSAFYTPCRESVIITDRYGSTIKSAEKQYSVSQGSTGKSYYRCLFQESLYDAIENRSNRQLYSSYHNGSPGIVSTDACRARNTVYEYTDLTSGGKWQLSLPLSVSTEYSTFDDNGVEHLAYTKTAYTYDTAGRVTGKRDFKSDVEGTWYLANTDTFQYNAGGKVISYGNTPYTSSNTLYTTYVYNADGKMTNETQPDGHQTNYTYNNLGQRVLESDAWFSILNSHSFDSFGRDIQQIRFSGSGTFTPDTTSVTFSTPIGMSSAYCVTTASSHSPTTTEYYDGLGRNVASGIIHFDGREFVTQRSYSNSNLLTFESLPHLKGTTTDAGTYYTYDSFNRSKSVTDPWGKTVLTTYYLGFTEIAENGSTTTLIYDGDGKLVTRTDDKGDVMYDYNALGDYSSIRLFYMNDDEVTVNFNYDKYGRISSLTDPNGTTRRWMYNSEGRVSGYKFGSSFTTYLYNAYGDVTRKSYKPRDTTQNCTYAYDSKRQLTTVNGPDYHETYTYDNAGRVTSRSRSVTAGNTITKGTTYTYYGENRIASIQSNVSTTQPLVETYTYQRGWLTDIAFNGKKVWNLASEGTYGNTASTSNWLSNTSYQRDNFGRLQTEHTYINSSSTNTPTHVQRQYSYDTHGRIASKDGKAYGYDSYNQLTSWNGNLYSYDDFGNITKSGGQGSITYNGYQLQSVTSPDTAVWGRGNLHMQNNGHNMPYYISLNKRNGDYICQMNLNYDAEGCRLYAKKENYLTQPMIINHENIEPELEFDFNRIYVDDRYEFIDKRSPASTGYLYIGGDPGNALAVAEINQNNVKLWQIFRDEQGSITAMSDSVNVRRYYYDPWGRYCDENGSMADSIYANGGNANHPFYRGFLGQEHYLDFGLVNLNARLYSPFQGRFLANDPVFDPSMSIIRFNPYIYGNNCPSMYVDPDGEIAWFLIGAAVVGGIINVADNWGRIDNVWQGIGCFVIGAASGVGYGCLTMTPVGLIQGIGWGAATGGMMEGLRCGLNNVVFGESFAEGFWDGAPRGMLFGAIFGGVSGYVNAKMYDCNWLNGKPLNSSYVKAEKILQSYDVEGRKPQIEPINPKESVVPDPKIVKYKQGMAEAYQKYPNKAGKIEYHHVIPKYILGYDNGVVVPIDAAYHQLITNEFRLRWGYGKGYIKDNEYLEQIIREVYDKYPLSPFD